MGLFSPFSSCLGALRRLCWRSAPCATSRENPIQTIPAPEFTLRPYFPMSPSGVHRVCLQAAGYPNKPNLVEAYLDKSLKGSIISRHKAEETNANIVEMDEPIYLQDDGGRQYDCYFMTTLTWYLPDKKTRTPEPEKFYIFDDSDDDIPVRFRKSIDPFSEHDNVSDLNVLANAVETKKSKKDQESFEEKERNKQGLAQANRQAAWQPPRGSQGGNNGNGGQGTVVK